MNFVIWHNPKCSKSRQTLSLLQDKEITPEIVLYLETPPTADELKSVLSKLDQPAAKLLRLKEAREEGISPETLTEEELISAMCKRPRLIERPVVICGNQACLGRPPETVLTLLRM